MSYAELIQLDRNTAAYIDASNGFTIFDGSRFPGITIATESRDQQGRIVAAIARYPDHSHLAYRWCPDHGPHFYIPE